MPLYGIRRNRFLVTRQHFWACLGPRKELEFETSHFRKVATIRTDLNVSISTSRFQIISTIIMITCLYCTYEETVGVDATTCE